MLLFIGNTIHGLNIIVLCFNTSHVTLYLKLNPKKVEYLTGFQYISCYSLSHVSGRNSATPFQFQYISCYSLSIDAVGTTAMKVSFNTSHVTLYQKWTDLSINVRRMFQYISCYSLSGMGTRLELQSKLFQYISCYSLSVTRVKILGEADEFQYISCYSLSVFSCPCFYVLMRFNTSHVTLYPVFVHFNDKT